MTRQTILYSLALAALLFLLKWAESLFMAQDLTLEFYTGVLAVFFSLLGVWVGRMVTAKKVVVERSAVVVVPNLDLGINPRELEVLRLIAEGHSNQEIADKLYLSINTIKKYSSALFAKLDVKRRTQAIERARQIGLIQ